MDEHELLSLYRDGYVILRQIIPQEMCEQAKRVIEQGAEQTDAKGLGGSHPALLDLFRATPLMHKALSAISPKGCVTGWAQPRNKKGRGDGGDFGTETPYDMAPNSCQIARVAPSSPPTSRIGGIGFPMDEIPHYEPSGGPWLAHLDGVWSGGSAPLQSREDDPTEWLTGPPGNGCPGPNDPHPNPGMRHINWTALVGVALTDQTRPGSGALGVLDGMHHQMEQFFRRQHAKGGPIGPDGPGWPRENADAQNGHGLNMIPPFLNAVTRQGAVSGPGGLLFPKPTLVPLAVGDAVICHHGVPHSSSFNAGPEDRIQVYFRLVRSDRPSGCEKAYPAAEMDNWLEWDGVRPIADAQTRAAGRTRNSEARL